MKRFLVRALSVVATLLMLGVFVFVWRQPGTGCDWQLRMNEARCVLSGTDPYAVWHGDVVQSPFCPLDSPSVSVSGDVRPLHVYPPWEYALVLPFSFVSDNVAWRMKQIAQFLAVFLVAVLVDLEARRRGFVRADAELTASVTLLISSYLVFTNAGVGNFAVEILLAYLILSVALRKGCDVLAGCCWAFAMIKPHLALPIAIPLLLYRKYKVCFVAAALCLSASLAPAFLSHTNPLDLIIETFRAGVGYFYGAGTIPYCCCGILPATVNVILGLLIGSAVCLWLTIRFKRCVGDDWFYVLMPVAVCSMTWTYALSHAHLMGLILIACIVMELVADPRSRFLWIVFVLSLPILSRVFLAGHGFCAFFGYPFPMSEYAFRVVDSLNSTASLALAVAFTLWKTRKGACDVAV